MRTWIGNSIREMSELSPAKVRHRKKMTAKNLPPVMLPYSSGILRIIHCSVSVVRRSICHRKFSKTYMVVIKHAYTYRQWFKPDVLKETLKVITNYNL